MANLKTYIFLLFGLFYVTIHAQTNPPIKINGTIKAKNELNDFLNVMIVNQTTGKGSFGELNGQFSISCNKNDTILVSVIGYNYIKLCYADSVFKDIYSPVILLDYKPVQLQEVKIFPKRDLEKIYKDIEKLGYNEKDYKLSGIDPLVSPITFLYQQFSRKEQAKRLAVELQNTENRRELLKELFAKYADAKIIDLDKKEFEQFVDYCNISDYILQNTTQYEFILIIKEKFKHFKKYGY